MKAETSNQEQNTKVSSYNSSKHAKTVSDTTKDTVSNSDATKENIYEIELD